MLNQSSQKMKDWIIEIFTTSINSISKESDRIEVIEWLCQAQQIVGSDKSKKDKFADLYRLTDIKKAVSLVLNSVVETIKNYKNSNLPLSVKIAIPATLFAAPFFGAQGAGIAALGGAIGVPALLLIFLGTAGIGSILEACVKKDTNANDPDKNGQENDKECKHSNDKLNT